MCIRDRNYDVEAFQNAAYGEHFIDALAELTDGKGGYAIIVGSVQAQTHMEWANAAVAYQKEKYPDMYLVADFVESNEDHDLSLIHIFSRADAPGKAFLIVEQ